MKMINKFYFSISAGPNTGVYFLIRFLKIPQYRCHLNNVRNATEGSLFTIDKKHVAHCCCSAGTPKIILPRLQFLTDDIVTIASFTVGFLAENTEQNLNFCAGLRLLIIIIFPQVPTECITRAFES